MAQKLKRLTSCVIWLVLNLLSYSYLTNCSDASVSFAVPSWMWITQSGPVDRSSSGTHILEVVDVVQKSNEIDPLTVLHSAPEARFIGNLKNKLCRMGLGVGCGTNSGMEKTAKPIRPQEINYVQPLVIQAYGKPIPAVPAKSSPNTKTKNKYSSTGPPSNSYTVSQTSSYSVGTGSASHGQTASSPTNSFSSLPFQQSSTNAAPLLPNEQIHIPQFLAPPHQSKLTSNVKGASSTSNGFISFNAAGNKNHQSHPGFVMPDKSAVKQQPSSILGNRFSSVSFGTPTITETVSSSLSPAGTITIGGDPQNPKVVKHVHVHKHIHKMGDGLANADQTLITSPDHTHTVFTSNAIIPDSVKFIGPNSKRDLPPMHHKLKQQSRPECLCVPKASCAIENVVETFTKEDISFMQDPRNKKSKQDVQSTSSETIVRKAKIEQRKSHSRSVNNSFSVQQSVTKTPESVKNSTKSSMGDDLLTKPRLQLKSRPKISNIILRPTLQGNKFILKPQLISSLTSPKPRTTSKPEIPIVKSRTANQKHNQPLQQERKILLNINRQKREVLPHLSVNNILELANLGDLSSMIDTSGNEKFQCINDISAHKIVKRSPQFIPNNKDADQSNKGENRKLSKRYAANGIDGLLNPVVKPSFGVHFGNPYGGTVHGGHYRGLYRPTAYNGNPFQFDVGPLTINPFGGVRFSVENGRLGIRPSLDVLVSPNFKERPYYPPPYTHAPYVQHPYPPYPQYPYQNFRRKRGHSVFRPSVPLYTQPYLLHSKANEATTLAKESHTDGRDDIFAKAS